MLNNSCMDTVKRFTLATVIMVQPFAYGDSSVAVEIPAVAAAATTDEANKANVPEPANPDSTTLLATPNSDEDNFVSDRITFPVAIWVTAIDLTTNTMQREILCAPAGTQFRGLGDRIATKDNKSSAETLFLVEKIGNYTSNLEHIKNILGLNKYTATKVNDDCATLNRKSVKVNQTVLLKHDRIHSFNPVRKGVSFGTLIVPYKYHPGGDSTFSGGTTLGGYLGYRVDRTGFTGFETNFISFAGTTTIAVPETSADGTTKIGNRSGFSYGVGVLAKVKNEFQLGFVIGRDSVDDAAMYDRNDKTWFALSLGFDFSN